MLLLIACVEDDVTDAPFDTPDAPGPHDAGVTTLHWTDPRGVALTAEVWYPAAAEGDPDPYEDVPFPSTAFRDAHPVAGPWPLVAFSHGNGGLRTQSAFLTERLATHGFVVVAPDHPNNTTLDFDASVLADVAVARPADVIASVDEVFARSSGGDALLGDLVEPDRYGMSGHSFGGWTTVAVAGGIVDFDALATFCAEGGGGDLCGLGDTSGLSVEAGPDPRAVAALPMAPAGWYSFGELGGVAPSLLMGGEKDESETMDAEILPLWDRLPVPKRLGVVADAGHYVFSDICAMGDLVEECAGPDEGWADPVAAHAAISTLAVAFFELTLNADDRYAEALAGSEIVEWDEAIE